MTGLLGTYDKQQNTPSSAQLHYAVLGQCWYKCLSPPPASLTIPESATVSVPSVIPESLRYQAKGEITGLTSGFKHFFLAAIIPLKFFPCSSINKLSLKLAPSFIIPLIYLFWLINLLSYVPDDIFHLIVTNNNQKSIPTIQNSGCLHYVMRYFRRNW